jgi:hypothetical protein
LSHGAAEGKKDEEVITAAPSRMTREIKDERILSLGNRTVKIP